MSGGIITWEILRYEPFDRPCFHFIRRGMRGLSALYVMLAHMYGYSIAPHLTAVSPIARWSLHWLDYGPMGVCVFIVISGFCLTLPVARSDTFELRGGFWGFIKRRAIRIIPPYYAALLVSTLAFGIEAHLARHPIALKTLALGLGSHVFLIHNLLGARASEYINGAMWSVALEWQIYIVFGLAMLPLLRKFGIWPVVLGAFFVGFFPHFALHGRVDWTEPWLLGVYALGVAAAFLVQRRVSVALFVAIASACAVAAAIYLARIPDAPIRELWPADVLIGVGTAAFICAGTQSPRWIFIRFLQSTPILLLGSFSYSLYLLHLPIVRLADLLLTQRHVSGVREFGVMVIVVAPLVIGFAYAFYLFAELPFISSFRSAKEHARLAAPDRSSGRISA